MNLTFDVASAAAVASLLALGACDLDDKSLGDTGADETIGGETEGASDGDPSGPPTDPSGDPTADPTADPTGAGCTEVGCTDGFFLTLSAADGFSDGNYQVQVSASGQPSFWCDFGMQAGAVEDADCDVVTLPNDTVLLTLPVTGPDIGIAVAIDGAPAGSGEFELAYEDVQPNGPGCEPICTQATAELAVGLPDSAETCEDLELAFAEEFEAVRGCEDANECGQVLSGFSCGCSRDWVGRTDSDPAELYQLAEDAQLLDCEWASWASTCDCPETDGFACIDNICQWNYVAGG